MKNKYRVTFQDGKGKRLYRTVKAIDPQTARRDVNYLLLRVMDLPRWNTLKWISTEQVV
jgi:hypothetical protein